MEDIYIIGSIIGTIVGFVVVIISIFKHFDSKFDRKIDRINEVISATEGTIKGHAARIDNLDNFLSSPGFRKWLAHTYKAAETTKEYTGNPISPEEKQRLIEKFENGTITKKETEKLKQILEEEKKEAEATGDSLAAIAIGLLLAALAYFLYELMSSEKKM